MKTNQKGALDFTVMAIIAVVLIVGGLLVVRISSSNDEASNSAVQLSSEELAKIEAIDSFEDCISIGEVDGGECIAPDGNLFVEGEDESDNVDDDSQSNDSDEANEQEVSEENNDNKTSNKEEFPNEGPDYDHDVVVSDDGEKSVELYLDSRNEFRVISEIKEGQSSTDIDVIIDVEGFTRDECELSVKTIADKPDVKSETKKYEALATQKISFIDGEHSVKVSCDDGEDELTASTLTRVIDRKAETCLDHDFNSVSSSSVTSTSDLKSEIIGTWVGCADSPWWPAYSVEITFNADGTYDAFSDEELDGNTSFGGFYDYSITGDDSRKQYDITSFTSGLGYGSIDIVHPNGTTVWPGTLNNILLDGDNLKFNFLHRNKYGPIVFSLTRN